MMEKAVVAVNDKDEGRARDKEPPPDGVQVEGALAAGAGALIGAAAGWLLWAYGDFEMKDESSSVKKSGVRQRTSRRADGQLVTSLHIDCESQTEAFRAAMAKDQLKRRPVLHAPHGGDWYESPRWHYHPFTHDVQEGDRLMVYHYIFPTTEQQLILSTDAALREEY